jgi:multidrug efflux pump subunit AcrA (membrane-fusion protein)
MPDLTASLDVELAREPGSIVVPRDAVRRDGERAFVRVRRGSSFREEAVTLGAANAHEVVVSSGLDEGAVIERNISHRVAQ